MLALFTLNAGRQGAIKDLFDEVFILFFFLLLPDFLGDFVINYRIFQSVKKNISEFVNIHLNLYIGGISLVVLKSVEKVFIQKSFNVSVSQIQESSFDLIH